jgi:hypothetical protein
MTIRPAPVANAFVAEEPNRLGEQAFINLHELSEDKLRNFNVGAIIAVQAGSWPTRQRTFATVA